MKIIPLLDLGNVVLRFDFEPLFLWMESKSQLSDAKKVRGLFSSSLLFDFEFGNIGKSEFIRRALALYRLDAKADEFDSKFANIFLGPMDGMDEWLSELNSAGEVYCLSNTNEIHLDFVLSQYPVLQKFKKIFASHIIHKRKPYPGIYRDIANELALPVSQIVFFDDLKVNVDGAKKAGLHAFLFEDAQIARSQLKQLQEMADKEGIGGEV